LSRACGQPESGRLREAELRYRRVPYSLMTNPIGPGERLANGATPVPLMPGGAAPIKPWPGELLSLSAGDVYVRSTPELPGAEPAMLVHGLGGSALNWTDLMGLLSQSAAGPPMVCDAPDLPGFGFSPPPADGDYSLAARAAVVISLIEKRANGPVHLIGNSLGGAISTRIAARRPDLVRTLTLISPALPDLRPRLLPARLAVVALPGVGRWLLGKMATMTPEQRTDTSIGELYADPSRFLPQRRAEAIAEVTRRDRLSYSVDALLGSTRALVAEYTRPGSASLWQDAAKVTAPTLLIHGSHDRLVNPAMAGRAARTFRNCRAIVLPRIGHVAMMERPELVAAEMRTFLRRALEQQACETLPARGSRRQGPAGGRSALSPASP
jgi:pimeloyl-ACP methyl ester carboxylesterase